MNTARTFNQLIVTTLFSILGSGIAALPAVAATDAPTSVVKYGDLQASSPQGASILYRRIRLAAEQVCSQWDGNDLASKTRMNACVKEAISGAVATVNQPALSAVYHAKYGMPEVTRVASR